MAVSRWRLGSLAVVGLMGVLTLAGLGSRSGADEGQADPFKPVPPGATVLFDGKDLSGWVSRKGETPRWKVADGCMEVNGGDIMTREKFGPDFHLHVEFWLPLMEKAKGQARANSGVYLQGRYEVQVLDSYRNDTYEDGSLGALYKLLTPNKELRDKAIKPPETWQAYDLSFCSPRVDAAGKVTEKGSLTVKLNGVTIIDNGAFEQVTGGALDNKIGTPGPILLQDHGCKVRYRNIWLQPLTSGKRRLDGGGQ